MYRYRIKNRPPVAPLTVALWLAVSAMGAVTSETISVDPPGPSQALALYLSHLASAANSDPWSEPNPVLLEIDASLPGLAEQGHLRAIRAWAKHQTPEYRVIRIEGDATVKQQVIARYLTAEKRAAAIPASSLAVTPANYKFHYAGSTGEPAVFAFHITPRKKRPGLIKGELWIDRATGLAVHEAGYLVKSPSMFIRRLKIIRDVSVRDGAPYLRTTHVEIDVRLAGQAKLTIVESLCDNQPSTIVATQGSQDDEHQCSTNQ
jgi:hypothetical protein